MDITRDVKYRGLELTGAVGGPGGDNPISGLRLTRVNFSEVSIHAYTEKRSLDDGFDASDVYLGTRNVELAGEVFAQEKAGLFDLLDALRLKFTPTDAFNEDITRQGYLPLEFSQPTLFTTHWSSGFVERVLYCRPLGLPQFSIDFRAIGGHEGDGYVVPFQVALQAKDPRFYHPHPIEVPMLGASGSGTMRNRGNYPTPLNFVLVPPANTQTVFTFVGMGTTMTVTVPQTPGASLLRVDSERKIVVHTGEGKTTLRMDLITFEANKTWPKVPPTPQGATAAGYSWSRTGGNLIGESRAFFSEAWV